jgi:2'-5' RNA ligase
VPLVEYADTSRWEEWQRDYRFGAFYIFPPSGVIEPLDELRRRYDPRSASYCQAHLSLSEPLTGPLSTTQFAELRIALSSVDPFDITYGPLRDFPPHPGIAYAIEPLERFMRLRSTIHATSLFAGAALARKDVPPHLTIAEFISPEQTAELLRVLRGNVPEGGFRCSSIEYAVPNRDFSFERVLTVPLGTSP